MPNRSLINGAAVNGGVDSAEPGRVASIRAARFGIPRTPANVVTAGSLRPARFGEATSIGGPTHSVALDGFRPTRFGTTQALAGMPPSSVDYPAASINPSRFGVPELLGQATHSQDASLAPVNFGAAVARSGYLAAGTRVALFGQGAVLASVSAAPGILVPRFGAPSSVGVAHAAGLRSGRFAPPFAETTAIISITAPLQPARFSMPDARDARARARPLMPVRVGSPVFDRGTAC